MHTALGTPPTRSQRGVDVGIGIPGSQSLVFLYPILGLDAVTDIYICVCVCVSMYNYKNNVNVDLSNSVNDMYDGLII